MYRLVLLLGEGALAFLGRLGGMFLLFANAVVEIFRPPFRVAPTVREVYQIGGQSVWVVGVLGLCFGMALAQQTGITLKRFAAEQYVGQLIALGMFRELGPVLTGFMVAARAGSGIAAEIGTMKVSEQIDAMRACGADPVRELVTPKLVASAFSLPLLTAMANVLGVVGGMIIAVALLNMDPMNYLYSVPAAVAPADFLTGLGKTFFFGVIIGTVSCHEGFGAAHGSMGVSRAATRAVVMSCILILIADLVLTGLIFAIGGILWT